MKKPRSLKHPGVRTVIAALDRAARAKGRGTFVCVAGVIAELGDTIGRFEGLGTMWCPEGVRAMVITQARWAPRAEFRRLVAEAKRQHKWCAWWDRVGYDESMRLPDDRDPLREAVH